MAALVFARPRRRGRAWLDGLIYLYAARFVERWLLAQPAVFPPPASLQNCEFMRDLGPTVALYDRYWTEIKAR